VKLPAPEDAASALDWHGKTRAALAELSGEPVVSLFVACLNGLTADFDRGDQGRDDWRGWATRWTGAMAVAHRSGDIDGITAEAERLDRDLDSRLAREEGLLPMPAIATVRQSDDRTLATLVARRLAAEIRHDSSIGQRLGSEWDLSERFSVSRATLRQAIRLLQDSGLVECRRGRGNGLVVRDLHGTGSIRLVLAFLISRDMDPTAAGTIMFQLNRFVPALALDRASRKQRERLAALLGRVRSSDPIDRYDLLQLVQYVSQLSDSPIIDLFSRCLAAYEARFHSSLRERLPANIQVEYFDLLGRLLEYAHSGDAERLQWAKRQSAQVMLEMSRSRPI
jgi:DNA-binding FadR family transcriptional regulator